MLSKGLLALIVLAACAGCATATSPGGGEPTASRPATGHGFGFASPVGDAEVPRCPPGLGYNRATGLCVSGGP
jgi:hypothetical protein